MKTPLFRICFFLTLASQLVVMGQGVNSTQIDPVSVFVLQDYVDNFNHGLNAGGPLTPFGNVVDVNQFKTLENAGRLGAGDAAIQLYTVGTGFGATTSQQLIGFLKKIDPLNLTDAANAKFDVTGYNAISYYIKDATGNSPSVANSPVDIVIEIVVGNGGDITPENPNDSFTGSTWTQSVPVKLSDLTSSYTRIVSQLDNSDFTRSVAPTNRESETDFSLLKNNITAVGITIRGNGDTGKQRGVLIDDINFFNNNVLTVKQDKVFVKGDGSATVTLTAKVTNATGVGQNGVNLRFTVNPGRANQVIDDTKTTDSSGVATYTYTATSIADIVEIKVEQR